MIVSTCGYLLFISCRNEAGYYGSALLIGLGNGHLWPAFQNMFISIADHNERGTATSTLFTSWDTGAGLGVLFGGVIAELMGYPAAFWSTALIHSAGALLFFGAARRFFLERSRLRDQA